MSITGYARVLQKIKTLQASYKPYRPQGAIRSTKSTPPGRAWSVPSGGLVIAAWAEVTLS